MIHLALPSMASSSPPPPAPADSHNDLLFLQQQQQPLQNLAMEDDHHEDHDPHLSALLDQLQRPDLANHHHHSLAMLSDEDLELEDVFQVHNNNNPNQLFREEEDPFLLETEIFAALSGIEDVVMVAEDHHELVVDKYSEAMSKSRSRDQNNNNNNNKVMESNSSSSSRRWRCAEDANDQQAFARACMSALLKSTSTGVDNPSNNNTSRPASSSRLRAAAVNAHSSLSTSSRKLQKLAAGSSTTNLSRLLDRKPTTNSSNSTANISAGESTRRRQLTRHFHTLRALLPPDDTPLIDRCSIIDRTCEYIHSLEGKLVFLQKKQKVMRAIKSNMEKNSENSQSRNTSLDQNDCDKPPYISIMLCKDGIVNVNVGCSSGSHQINFSNVLHALEKLGFDVLTAKCSQGPNTILYAFSVKVNLLEFPIDELRSKLLQMMQWS